jgi:hypothetical protein
VDCGDGQLAQSSSCTSSGSATNGYSGGCTGVCVYQSSTTESMFDIKGNIGGVNCGFSPVTVAAIPVNYNSNCNVNVQPTSLQNGSVVVTVGFNNMPSTVPPSLGLDCGGGELPTQNVNLQCDSHFSGPTLGYAGSCSGSCSYNSSPSQINIPLSVQLAGVSSLGLPACLKAFGVLLKE